MVEALKSLGGSKTVSFCVARGLQLLDAAALLQLPVRAGVSQVCQPALASLPRSVPRTDEALERVPGFKALETLFFDQA